MVWFHMDVGRRNNADPKWILPLLCRRGKITREEIGAIKIFDRETKVEISESVAKKFAAAAEVSDGDDITISMTESPGDGGARAGRGPSGKPRGKKPYQGKRQDGAPTSDKPQGKPRRPKRPKV